MFHSGSPITTPMVSGNAKIIMSAKHTKGIISALQITYFTNIKQSPTNGDLCLKIKAGSLSEQLDAGSWHMAGEEREATVMESLLSYCTTYNTFNPHTQPQKWVSSFSYHEWWHWGSENVRTLPKVIPATRVQIQDPDLALCESVSPGEG